MKMMSVIAVSPKEGAVDEITDLIVDSRKNGVEGLDTYNIVHTHEDQLLVVRVGFNGCIYGLCEWSS